MPKIKDHVIYVDQFGREHGALVTNVWDGGNPDANPTASINLVRQEDPWGCMVAALAMIMGVSYAEMKARIHPGRLGDLQDRGIGQTEADGLLAEYGYALARRFQHYHGQACDRSEWPPAPWADVHLCEVQTSQSHAVVMLRDGRVLDPWYGEREGLHTYSRTFWVAAVYRVHDGPLPQAILTPDDPRRLRPRVCSCQAAWPAAGLTPG